MGSSIERTSRVAASEAESGVLEENSGRPAGPGGLLPRDFTRSHGNYIHHVEVNPELTGL